MSAAMLNVAVVCFPTAGGSGVIASELAVGLARRGHHVHVLSSAALSRPLPACERLQFHLVEAPSYPPLDAAPYALALASALIELARREPLDLVHVHYALPHAASALLARQALGARAPRLITTLHGTDVTRLGHDPSYAAITRAAVAASDAISVPSRFLQSEARRVLELPEPRAIDVIPNFVDTEHFAPPAARDPERLRTLLAAHGMDTSGEWGPVLFHASTFRAVKRPTDLIETLQRVRKHVPARLLLVGDGPERASAERRSQELQLSPYVAWLGSRPEFVEYLQHADVFLSSSETESFGVAALEALSSGVPVCGYRVGGVPEVVGPDAGRLVAPNDVNALANAVLELLALDAPQRLRLSAAARAHALANFRLEPALDRYEALYRRTLSSPAQEHA